MLILASNCLVLALHCYQMAWRYVRGGSHIPLVKVAHIYTGLLLQLQAYWGLFRRLFSRL